MEERDGPLVQGGMAGSCDGLHDPPSCGDMVNKMAPGTCGAASVCAPHACPEPEVSLLVTRRALPAHAPCVAASAAVRVADATEGEESEGVPMAMGTPSMAIPAAQAAMYDDKIKNGGVPIETGTPNIVIGLVEGEERGGIPMETGTPATDSYSQDASAPNEVILKVVSPGEADSLPNGQKVCGGSGTGSLTPRQKGVGIWGEILKAP